MASLTRSDLQFIFAQIQIAEANAAGTPLTDLIPNQFLSLGLRRVDGSFNNLLPGQSGFGASDQNFLQGLTPVFTNEMDETSFFGVGNTNYATSGPGANVVDRDPRIISNLIVDQTVTNPAAYQTAFDPGLNGVWEFGSAGADKIFGTGDDTFSDDVLKPGAHLIDGFRFDGSPFQTLQFDAVAPDVGLSPPPSMLG